jgi:4-hydroxybenzoate polyprenyltransferase
VRKGPAALLRASHPLPGFAVTAFGTALGMAAGLGPGRTVLLAGALLAGQLSIGWCNDAVDAERDRLGGRQDKPVAGGAVTRRAVAVAAGLALAACVPLSLALGARPGGLHLVAVASAWGYDLGLKRTPASPLPYLLSFGLLPGIAATAAGRPPPVLLMVAAGLLGVAGHFANTVPDAAVDRRTGVRGLPQRLGPRRSQWVAAAGVVGACGVLLAGAPLSAAATVLLVAAAVLGATGAAAPGTWSFRLVLASAAVAVAGVVAAGPALLT